MWRPKWRKPWMPYKQTENTVSIDWSNEKSFIEIKSEEYVQRWNESLPMDKRASKLMLDFLNRYKEDPANTVSRISFIENKLKYYIDQFQLYTRVKRELKLFYEQLKKQ